MKEGKKGAALFSQFEEIGKKFVVKKKEACIFSSVTFKFLNSW
jgi:hypothetical protein